MLHSSPAQTLFSYSGTAHTASERVAFSAIYPWLHSAHSTILELGSSFPLLIFSRYPTFACTDVLKLFGLWCTALYARDIRLGETAMRAAFVWNRGIGNWPDRNIMRRGDGNCGLEYGSMGMRFEEVESGSNMCIVVIRNRADGMKRSCL